MADSRDITGKNRKFTGTGGIKLPTGTTGERVNEQAQIRFNTTTNLAEYYNGTEWKSIDAPPVITVFTVDGGAEVTSAFIDASVGGNATIEIKGSLFDTTGANVTFIGTGETLSTATITRNSANLLTVTVARSGFDNSNEPYTIKVTNGSGLSAELAGAILQDAAPAFSTAADTTVLSTYEGQSAPFSETTLVATDADGDTVTHTISAGSLPPGLSLSTAGALTGTVSGSSIQNYTFTVQAATSFGNSTRQFVIAITANPFISATGGTVTESGDYKIHTFTGPGTFTVTRAGTPLGSDTVDYLVVAGGGSGGLGNTGSSAAGGAGGLRFSAGTWSAPAPVSPRAGSSIPVSATSFPITVGGGGAAVTTAGVRGISGNNSVFSTITSAGGGAGGGHDATNGLAGGSGGGGATGSPTAATSGAAGNTPPVSPSQGNPGGDSGPHGPNYVKGGGGGAGAAGTPGPSGGTGGAGLQINIDGNNYYWAGGGGSAAWVDGPSAGNGGIGGGGGGGTPSSSLGNVGSGGGSAINSGGDGVKGGVAGSGVTNSGGGGGSNNANNSPKNSGAGGSGIVVIRYKFQ